METVIHNIIKKQNEELLKCIARKLNIDEEYLLKKYHIPTYYSMKINRSLNYPLIFRDKNGRS